jgi:molybdopterin converting factor small subunit
MQVIVIFAPLLDKQVGIRECVIEVEIGTDFNLFFELLTERYGETFKEIASLAGKHSGILVLCNNQIVISMDEKLSDGDEISFAIPLSGG